MQKYKQTGKLNWVNIICGCKKGFLFFFSLPSWRTYLTAVATTAFALKPFIPHRLRHIGWVGYFSHPDSNAPLTTNFGHLLYPQTGWCLPACDSTNVKMRRTVKVLKFQPLFSFVFIIHSTSSGVAKHFSVSMHAHILLPLSHHHALLVLYCPSPQRQQQQQWQWQFLVGNGKTKIFPV